MTKKVETVEAPAVAEAELEFEYRPIGFRIKGTAPLLMHNGLLADPLNPHAKAIKAITAKGKKKTDEDMEQMALLEWEGGLYVGEGDRVVIPGDNIEGMLISGAMKFRKGPECRAGLLCDGNWPLEYGGPRDIEKLKADGRFRDTRKAGIKGNSVMRTRPIFPSWSLAFTVMYLPSVLNADQIVQFLQVAGKLIGLCDYTPKFGRFRVVEVNKDVSPA